MLKFSKAYKTGGIENFETTKNIAYIFLHLLVLQTNIQIRKAILRKPYWENIYSSYLKKYHKVDVSL